MMAILFSKIKLWSLRQHCHSISSAHFPIISFGSVQLVILTEYMYYVYILSRKLRVNDVYVKVKRDNLTSIRPSVRALSHAK